MTVNDERKVTEIELESGWQLRRLDETGPLDPERASELAGAEGGDWMDVPRMPMQVHDVLAARGDMPRPGETGSAEAGRGVAESGWVYRLRLDEPLPAAQHDLLCRGLDTVADVWCNGRLVHRHRSCYSPALVPLRDALNGDGRDVILIHFQPPEAWARCELAGYLTERDRELGVEALRMLQKPRQDFGEFLGPRFTPIGVYAPVTLRGHAGAACDTFSPLTELDDRTDVGTVTVEMEGRAAEHLSISLELLDPDGSRVAGRTVEARPQEGRWTVSERLEVDAPHRWYPRGMGEQPLYTLRAELQGESEPIQSLQKTVGFRSFRREGEFSYLINGRPVRLWGVNLPPIKPGHVWDRERAERLLDMVEHAHCNIIRIWGPGQPYDNDHLLAEADRRGLLVWFEFPHEFFPHPENPAFIEACTADAASYVRRHRHHPGVLLWCGGNEGYLMLDEQFSPESVPKTQSGRALFEGAYVDLCRSLDPTRPYRPQSPAGGPFANSPVQGDTHCYNDLCVVPGIGWPVMATEHFRFTVPRPWSLRRWLGDDAWPDGFVSALRGNDSEGLIPESWRRLCSSRRLETCMFGPLGEFYDTGHCLEGLVDKMDAASMKYIRRSVERMRRGRSRHDTSGRRHCRGHLWWKLNETWPKLRNALVDADGEPSGSYYALRRAYAPLLLSFELDEDDRLWLWAVNDTSEPVEGTVRAVRQDEPAERVLQTMEAEVCLAPDESRPVLDLSRWGSFFRNCVLCAALVDGGGRERAFVSDTVALEICCRIPDPELTGRREGDSVTLTCTSIARRVTLQGPPGAERGWLFGDNYFDLIPGRSKTVKILRAGGEGPVHVRWAGRYEPQPLDQA